MNRPTGVTVIAVLCFLGAAFCLLGGLGMMIGGGAIAAMMSQQNAQGSAGMAGMMAGLGAALGIFLLVIAVLEGVVGFGLWKLKEWARIVTIVLTAIGALFQLPGLFTSLIHFNIGALIWVAIWLAVDVWIIMYLLKPEVKAAFQGVQARAASA